MLRDRRPRRRASRRGAPSSSSRSAELWTPRPPTVEYVATGGRRGIGTVHHTVPSHRGRRDAGRCGVAAPRRGSHSSAQGNALGTGDPQTTQALQGRNSLQRTTSGAPSGLVHLASQFPGRCPGLSNWCPVGAASARNSLAAGPSAGRPRRRRHRLAGWRRSSACGCSRRRRRRCRRDAR